MKNKSLKKKEQKTKVKEDYIIMITLMYHQSLYFFDRFLSKFPATG